MIRYILERAGQALISLFGASIIVFMLSRATGDPVSLLLPPTATAEDAANLRRTLGLDGSWAEQYFMFVSNALQGDFGQSIQYRIPAIQVVGDRIGATLSLGLIAFAVTALIAIPAGVIAASKRDRPFDHAVRWIAATGQSLPSFWVGGLLILLFSVVLGWLPTSGMKGPQSYVMPVATLVILGFAGLVRMSRSATLETLGTEYVKFARAKGVAEGSVLWNHAFRNASLSVLTFGALMLLNLLSGSIIVETVFGWPGLGSTVVAAVNQRDFPVVQVIVLLLSAAYIAGNLIVDVLYALLNPKIRSS